MIKQGVQIMIAAVLVIGAGIPVADAAFKTELKSNTQTGISSSGSVPDSFTVSPVEFGLVKDSVSVTLTDSSDGTTYKLSPSQFDVKPDTGKITVQVADVDGDGTNEINATTDSYEVSYQYKPNGYAGGLAAVILPFVLVGMAALVLLGSFRPFLQK